MIDFEIDFLYKYMLNRLMRLRFTYKIIIFSLKPFSFFEYVKIPHSQNGCVFYGKCVISEVYESTLRVSHKTKFSRKIIKS